MMEKVKHFFKDSTLIRYAYTILGIVVLIASISDGQWFGAGLGALVFAMGIFGLSCAGGSCASGNCSFPTKE